MSEKTSDTARGQASGCNVSSRLNFAIGGVALAAAAVAGWLIYFFWFR